VKKLNATLLLTSITTCLLTSNVQAQVAAQNTAKKIYERLTSIKISGDSPVLQQMTEKVAAGDLKGAAAIATADKNFLNVTVKQMALKMSTREETLRIPLNDFAASFIGVTRDQSDARELLTGNFYYMGDLAKINPAQATVTPPPEGYRILEDLVRSNRHYETIDNGVIDIGAVLKRVEGQQLASQNDANVLVMNNDPAGVLTSRSFMMAHAIAGTNRRLVEYTFREFMCVPISEWSDTGASDTRIGRDIDRFPGGSHQAFETTCKGCHTQMDSLRGAFAFWDVNGDRVVNRGISSTGTGRVAQKYSRLNTVFPDGYVTIDNSFINNSKRPGNAALFGWRGANTDFGYGVRDLGMLVANSQRFSQCMAKRVFETVCRKNIEMKFNLPIIKAYAQKFEASGYKFKQLFEDVATSPECLQ
jgi:hypothetical protein